MSNATRFNAIAAVALLATQPAAAQVRTLAREPVLTTRALSPIATATLNAVGGSVILANVVVRAFADNVNMMSASGIGGPGEMQMHVPIRTTGEPGSRLTVRSDAPMPSGTYSVAIGFTHAKTGDAVRFVDGNTGAVLGSCSMTQQPNWHDVQPCATSVALMGARLDLIVEPTSGVQLYPTTITVSQFR
ncbi:MAG: hypothetical protein AB7R55_02190 [Gemmatimonadales bacterium]